MKMSQNNYRLRSQINNIVIDDGLALINSWHASQDECLQTCSSDDREGRLIATFCLDGEAGYRGEAQNTVHFKAKTTTLVWTRLTGGERYFPARTTTHQIRLILNRQGQERYLGKRWFDCMESNKDFNVLMQRKTPNWQTGIIRHLTQTHLMGLHLQLNVLTLLLDLFMNSGLLPSTPKFEANVSVAERMEQILMLMQMHMDQPLSLYRLSLAVGMNECDFKAAFRHHFNTTPHQMLIMLRMQKARTLLLSGQQVAQTAWTVGYSHPSTFSEAFKRFFGYPPTHIQKNSSPTSPAR